MKGGERYSGLHFIILLATKEVVARQWQKRVGPFGSARLLLHDGFIGARNRVASRPVIQGELEA
jgi:hypothetical protein